MKKNSLFKQWFFGESPDNPISQTRLIENFEAVVHSRQGKLILMMWDSSPRLRNWYSGVKTKQDKKVIKKDEMVDRFVIIISSQNEFIQNAIWDANPALQRQLKKLDHKKR